MSAETEGNKKKKKNPYVRTRTRKDGTEVTRKYTKPGTGQKGKMHTMVERGEKKTDKGGSVKTVKRTKAGTGRTSERKVHTTKAGRKIITKTITSASGKKRTVRSVKDKDGKLKSRSVTGRKGNTTTKTGDEVRAARKANPMTAQDKKRKAKLNRQTERINKAKAAGNTKRVEAIKKRRAKTRERYKAGRAD